MALQVSLSHQSWPHHANPITPPDPTSRSSVTRSQRRVEFGVNNTNPNKRNRSFFVQSMRQMNVVGERIRVRGQEIRASLETVGTAESETLIGKVTEVNNDSFWPTVKAVGNKTVVLDMYTQWCGPCKVMAPKYKELAEKYDDVVFLKLDCNQENRPLAKELGIRVVPTFKVLKDGKIVDEVTGAKLEKLVAAIEAARIS